MHPNTSESRDSDQIQEAVWQWFQEHVNLCRVLACCRHDAGDTMERLLEAVRQSEERGRRLIQKALAGHSETVRAPLRPIPISGGPRMRPCIPISGSQVPLGTPALERPHPLAAPAEADLKPSRSYIRRRRS